MIVEVFKTNVKNAVEARMLMGQIRTAFPEYTANFDLEDCDKILRVESSAEVVCVTHLVRLLNEYGFKAEVLSDDIPVNEVFQF